MDKEKSNAQAEALAGSATRQEEARQVRHGPARRHARSRQEVRADDAPALVARAGAHVDTQSLAAATRMSCRRRDPMVFTPKEERRPVKGASLRDLGIDHRGGETTLEPALDQWIDRYRTEFCLAPPPGFSLASMEGAAG